MNSHSLAAGNPQYRLNPKTAYDSTSLSLYQRHQNPLPLFSDSSKITQPSAVYVQLRLVEEQPYPEEG